MLQKLGFLILLTELAKRAKLLENPYISIATAILWDR